MVLLSNVKIVLLTVILAGVQFAWTVEFAYGSPYLVSLGLPKYLTALVWMAAPLSGFIVQPIIGAWSDNSPNPYGKRRPFIVINAFLVLVSIVLMAYCQSLTAFFSPHAYTKEITLSIAVFAFYLLDFSINAVIACCRALIVDVTPTSQQDAANSCAAWMKGCGNVIGYYIGSLDLPLLFGKHPSPPYDNPQGSPILVDQVRILGSFCIVFFSLAVFVTCISITEEKLDSYQKPNNTFKDYIIEIIYQIRNLPANIQTICNIQFMSWYFYY
jgi:solute carrier family 45 protein 1/2/4